MSDNGVIEHKCGVCGVETLSCMCESDEHWCPSCGYQVHAGAAECADCGMPLMETCDE